MSETIWYGERGIVNALITGLKTLHDERSAAGQDGMGAYRDLLHSITWADSQTLPWIEKLSSFSAIVELGLFEFGDPDLILIARTSDSETYLVFVEAKATRYGSSAQPNENGIAADGFNSSINGQLALKYRFAHALQNWPDNEDAIIREPANVHASYAMETELGGLGDPKSQPRHVGKQSILRRLRELGFKGHPVSKCYFVAWTWDRVAFFNDEDVGSECHPLLLDPDETGPWAEKDAHIGWLGYDALASDTRLGQRLGDEFHRAIGMMLEGYVPPPVASAENEKYSKFPADNLAQLSNDALKRFELLENVAMDRFGIRAVQRQSGSTSVKLRGRVRLKLLIRRGKPEPAWIAVSTSFGHQTWSNLKFNDDDIFRIGVGSRAQLFYARELPTEGDVETVGEVCDEILERLDSEDPS